MDLVTRSNLETSTFPRLFAQLAEESQALIREECGHFHT
jgi:hypothetical protein